VYFEITFIIKGMIKLVQFTLLFATLTHASVVDPNFPNEGVLSADKRGFFDETHDYSQFSGRVSDKDKTGRILKVKVENNNTKFFQDGDFVEFYLNQGDPEKTCKAYVRSAEDFYFTIYVQDFSACYSATKYFRRGTVVHFTSEILAKRVFEASKMRELLMVKKADFLKQLSGINHFLWSFDQQKIKATAELDERINELMELKRKAVDRVIDKKKENIDLQAQLIKQLNDLDQEMKFYRVERQENMTDRWNTDHDRGLPFGQRPMALKDK
jgi:hypothetical protein